MVSYDYDRRVAAGSYTTLYYDLVETLRRLRDEYGADPRIVGIQSLHSLRLPRLARSAPYHKLYFHLGQVLDSFYTHHGADPKRVLEQALETLKHEPPRTASGPWQFKPVPVPGGKPGEILYYATPNGRAELRRSKGKEWSLFLDGREIPIHSRRPEFGHAETLLRQELGPDYARHG